MVDPTRKFSRGHCILADCILYCRLYVLNSQKNAREIYGYNRIGFLSWSLDTWLVSGI